jgi:hypothetical protein
MAISNERWDELEQTASEYPQIPFLTELVRELRGDAQPASVQQQTVDTTQPATVESQTVSSDTTKTTSKNA